MARRFDPFTVDRRQFLGLAAAGGTALLAQPLLSGQLLAEPAPQKAAFGIPVEDLQAVMAVAMARGGTFADLYFERTRSVSLSLEDDKISRAYTSSDLGMGVRVVKGDAVGYAFSEVLDLKAMKQAAATAAAIADGKRDGKPATVQVAKLPKYYDVDYRFAAIDLAKKKALVQDVNGQIRKKDARILKVNVSYADSDREVLILTSDGLLAHDHQPMMRLTAACVAEQGGRRETGSYNIASRHGFDLFDPKTVTRLCDEAVRRTVGMFEAVTPKGGEMPVVLGAGPSGILLHEAIGHGMEADFNRKNTSIYATKIGKPVAEKFVTIVDDATLPDARGSIHVDDEGTSGQRTVLVDGGIMASYLHDRISAAHYGLKSTGSGRRESFRHVPMPRMRSTYMQPGPHRKDEIIASVKKGIYCESFSNGQVNIGGGDYTFFLKTGYLIEDGKLGRPIKDVNLIGNGPDTLSKISMVGNDLLIDEGGWTCGKNGQSVPVSQGMPTVLVKSLTVGGAA
ncbi:MAG: TldD/PmbA family protein [Deltaproteobacteria bacterium]|nr:TldD/PmbA family protein [Deltaproteobacteria bacterium]